MEETLDKHTRGPSIRTIRTKTGPVPVQHIQESCPWPAADTRLGTQNLCEGPKHTLQHTLHIAQRSVSKANCMLVLCTYPRAGGVYVGLVPRERGDRWVLPPPPVDTFVTNLPAISPPPTPWQRLGNTFPEHLSPIPMTALIPAQVSTF